jgi:RNA polymerase sigma factor (sigma-70 family)
MYNEIQLIDSCVEGDAASQEKLYKLFSGKMMGVCLRYAKDRMEAEDVLQEGFIKVFDNLHKFRKDGSLEGWIRRVIVNTALRNYKNNAHRYDHADITTVEYKANVHDTNSVLSAQDLLKMIQTLPQGYKVVFNLYAIEGFTHKEISEMLGINEGTSKSQLARARKLLQSYIFKETTTDYGKLIAK